MSTRFYSALALAALALAAASGCTSVGCGDRPHMKSPYAGMKYDCCCEVCGPTCGPSCREGACGCPEASCEIRCDECNTCGCPVAACGCAEPSCETACGVEDSSACGCAEPSCETACGVDDESACGCAEPGCAVRCGDGCGNCRKSHWPGFRCHGCGELYWSEWFNDPPAKCDPCDIYGNYIGPGDPGYFRAPYLHAARDAQGPLAALPPLEEVAPLSEVDPLPDSSAAEPSIVDAE